MQGHRKITEKQIRSVIGLFPRRLDFDLPKKPESQKVAQAKRRKEQWPKVHNSIKQYRWSVGRFPRRTWQPEELKVLFDKRLTEREKAFLLQRSIPSVSLERQFLLARLENTPPRSKKLVAELKRILCIK